MQWPQEIAQILLRIKAVSLSINPPFTWNTGLVTPIYCDNRLILSYPEERGRIVEGYKQLIADNNLEFDVIAGTATAGIPWAAFVAHELNKPMVYVRSHPKDYGKAKQVEGTMPKGSRVLIVEDLISTGRSSLASVAACKKEYDAITVAVLSIFTYQMEKSKIAFAQENISQYSMTDFSTLLSIATQSGYLKPEEKESALSWSTDPENWWASISQKK